MRLPALLSPTRALLRASLLTLPLALGGCVGDDSAGTDSSTSTASASATSTASASATTDDTTSTGDTSTASTDPTSATDPTSTTDPTTTDETTSAGPTSTTENPTTTDDTTTTSTTGDPLHPVVTIETNLGDIVLQLDAELAPITTDNFLVYVDNGFYDGEDGNSATIFHRVVKGFVMQGGGLTSNLSQKSTLPPIVNESGNGLTNIRGSVAMARTQNPDSATSQFYINLVDNLFLDDPPGYAVFGQVIEGIEVVDAIGEVPVNGQDVPVDTITILDAYQN